jgi:hypothetical protein
LAPDFDVVSAIHSEGVTRSTVLRTFDDACQRLGEGGSSLTNEGIAELRNQQQVLDEAVALMTDWNTYCVVQLVWSLSARQAFAAFQPLQLGYVSGCLVAAKRAVESLLPIYWSRATLALESDPRMPELLETVAGLLDRLRSGVARHFPMPPHLRGVDVPSLLAS